MFKKGHETLNFDELKYFKNVLRVPKNQNFQSYCFHRLNIEHNINQ